MPEEFNVVGTAIRRVDGVEKATGQAMYSTDCRPPQALWGRILYSPHSHAKIIAIDTSKAEKLLGVKAVVTAEDTTKLGFGVYRHDKPALAVDKVRFVGEEVAAVAAIDEDAAEEALSLIRVEYEILPAVYDLLEAMKPGAPLIHDFEKNIGYEYHILRGNVEEGFKRAKVILEETFATPMVHQGYLETMTCLAQWDGSGRLTIQGAFKNVHTMVEPLARVIGIEEGKIRAIQTHVGGGFGARGGEMFGAPAAAALLARKARRPVFVESSREAEFMAGRPRVPAHIKLKLGLDQEGFIVAKQAQIIADAGAYTGMAPRIMETMTRRPDCIYRMTNVKNDSLMVFTNKTPSGAYRGFGNPQKTFALESLLDMAAEKLSMDPAEVRLKNAIRQGDVTVHGWRVQSCGLTDCIRKATEAASWKEKKAKKRPYRGLGIACMIHVSGRRQAPGFFGSRALIKVTENGNLHVISGENDVGQGWKTAASIIAAEVIGVPIEHVKVVQPDTDISPFALGPFSDRTTLLGGNAVRLAAQDARKKILNLAAEMLEAQADDLIITQGKIHVRGVPAKAVTIEEVAKFSHRKRDGQLIWGQGDYDPPSEFPAPPGIYGNVSTSYTFAAQVAEVEVDPGTGKVTIVNFVGAHDLGRALFPLGAEGQIEGATGQGIGWIIMEDMLFDNGTIMNPNFLEYRMPTAGDMPVITPILVETIDPFGPFGAKGVAEPGLVPVAPAIANAIYDAVGVRTTTLPVTPQQILAAMEAKAQRGKPSSVEAAPGAGSSV